MLLIVTAMDEKLLEVICNVDEEGERRIRCQDDEVDKDVVLDALNTPY